jgi:hypothetical protein
MGKEELIFHTSDPYKREGTHVSVTRTIYYGEVVDIIDPTDGGQIKVKIPDLDNKTGNADLPWCYPMLPKFFHIYPKVGEMVRVFIEDVKYPQRSRYWMGSVISQPQNINFDSIYTALSTTNMALTNPQPAPTTYPDAAGVYPEMEDVAIVGRVNTDVILRINQVSIRAGKHENGNVLKLNVKNPATIDMIFEPKGNQGDYYSNTIIQSDKIAILSHEGNPQFRAARLTAEDRTRIFTDGHPMARADVLVEALKVLRNAILTHIHPYSNLPADKTAIINSLEQIDFDAIMQKNIVIN